MSGDELIIDLEEVAAMVRIAQGCPTCSYSHGVIVMGQDWDIVLLHASGCDWTPSPTGTRLRSIAGGAA